jgi:hypothetical protein
VIARSVVLDPDTNQPILVRFNEDGKVDVPAEYLNNIDQLSVVPASDYRFYNKQKDDFLLQYASSLAQGAELMSRQEFLQETFKASDGLTVISQEGLIGDSINSVLVRGQSNRILPLPEQLIISPLPEQLILLSFPIDLTQTITIAESDIALVVTKDGTIIAQSALNIGYRTGFFGDATEAQDGFLFNIGEDDTVFGPVPGVKVNIEQSVFPGGIGVSGADGKYSFTYLLPICPPGGFDFTTDVWAELRYKNFMPVSSPSIPYYLRMQSWDFCFAQLLPPFASYQNYPPGAGSAYQHNMKVDVMFLTGLISLKNIEGEEVEIGETTTYTAFDENADTRAQEFYDFNGDGASDTVLLGTIKTITNADGVEVEAFVLESEFTDPEEEAELQGIYFDGAQDDPEEMPDIVRIVDRDIRFDEPVGVLATISQDDLRNTDVLFFRESTGQLIMERRGLKEEESDKRKATRFDEENNQVAYRIMLRGPLDKSINVGGGLYSERKAGFEEWAVANQLEAPFQARESDHIKPGETIKIVAINRATGYTGTARVQLESAGENGSSELGVHVPTMTMVPPNLKVWAERNYDVEQGLTEGEERTYTIGAEGAALTSDTTVTIYTEWLDEFGRPLPEELGLDDGEQYGLTGRLAKIVAEDTLQAASAGSDLAEFPIAPGRNTQVVNVGSNLSTAEHYYIHVNGMAKDQECEAGYTCPSFDVSGAAVGVEAPYDARPSLLTPFLVPLYLESDSLFEYNAYRGALQSFDPSVPDAVEPDKPLPAYAWQYRPEYQFSVYELEMQEINRINVVNEAETTTNIIDLTRPVIDPTDDYMDILYSMLTNDHNPLSFFGPERELVFSIGGQEAIATLGDDNTLRFDNVEHLRFIDAEDFLTIRLYANNDAANILWEYEFGINGLHVAYQIPDAEEDVTRLLETTPGGDTLVRSLGGIRLKYRYQPPAGEAILTIAWEFDTDGWVCSQAGYEGGTGCSHVAAGTQNAGFTSATGERFVWWEPSTGAPNPESRWENGMTVNASYEATTVNTATGQPNSQTRSADFVVQTRELQPLADDPNNPQAPMNGVDVKVLEALLWQLGLSPQLDNPGSEGARINSARTASLWTQTCANQPADRRDIFYPGWAGCTTGLVSMEAMVRRFQARNATSSTHNNLVKAVLLDGATGVVDTDTLGYLKRDWKLYHSAYELFSGNSSISPVNDAALMATWVSGAVDLWTNGSGTRVPSNTYTANTHDGIVQLAGLTPGVGNNRNAFLNEWITHESTHHWGGNAKQYQETTYRMTEGGADEHGSLSFSQLLYGHRFGQTPCAAHADSDLNLYEPSDNVKTFVIHTASDNGVGAGQVACKGLIYRGFHTNDQTLDVTFVADMGIVNSRAGNVADLRGYRHNSGNVTAIPTNEDDYDVLAKAVMGYNSGEGYADDYSWAKFLKYKEYLVNSPRNTGRICHSCRYSIEVRKALFGANMRTFIWEGGQGVDVNSDGAIADVPDDPVTPQNEAVVETTIPWCFAYGEEDWVNPFNVPLRTGGTRLARFNDYLNRANRNNAHQVNCP